MLTMPAWYTDNAPTSDAQVAAHFSSKRPILGLCLKRYSYTADGRAIRLGTQIDIPIEIGVPHFIQDDNIDENSAFHGNFKLSLQAVVCHRGNSVDSGHYIALVRGQTTTNGSTGSWMRFDDLAATRIQVVDIERALREETPYLLFYQIVPIEGDPGSITAGEECTSTMPERNASMSEASSVAATDTSERRSFEINVREELNGSHGHSPNETRRASIISFQEPVSRVPTNPTANGQTLLIPEAAENTNLLRPKPGSRSQSKTSDGGGIGGGIGGLGRTLSKLRRKSREVSPPKTDAQPEVHVKEIPQPAPRPASHSATAPPPPSQKVHISGQQVLTHHPATTAARQPGLQVVPQQAKTHKRDKSKSRLSRSGKPGEKPDRECLVM
jgi:hypothetical protein